MATSTLVTQFIVVLALILALCILLKLLVQLASVVRRFIAEKLRVKKRKVEKPDPWAEKYGYSWDYVMVVKVRAAEEKCTSFQKENSLKSIVQKINQSGLETTMFFSATRTHVFIKIRCPLERLREEADRINLRLLLDDSELSRRLARGKLASDQVTWLWKPFSIPEDDPHVSRVTPYKPYHHIYYKYVNGKPDIQCLYATRSSSHKCIFRSVDRIKLIVSIIKASEGFGGCGLDPTELVEKKALEGAFPLHDYEALRAVDRKIVTCLQFPWSLNVDAIKDYFGEKIGFYFTFLEHYTTWLLLPSLVGILVWINSAVTNSYDAALVPALCIFIAIWSTLFLEFWKRKQIQRAMLWGMTDFREEEQQRPRFHGQKAIDPITGKPTIYFPRSELYQRLIFSQTTIAGVIIVVAGIVASIFVLKWFLLKSPQDHEVAIGGTPLGGIIASLANAIQIQVTNALYQRLALWLNDLENHRTETEYEDALIAKTFLFQFANSYASLIYIAFVKKHLEGCAVSCMAELSTALGSIFITRVVVGNTTEVLVPYVKLVLAQRKMRQAQENEEQELSLVEEQFMAEEYHVTLGPFADYLELVIQFGYATMFVGAFPLALVMSFVNNYLEIRVDGWKICQQTRRPEPRGAEDIGTWYLILEVMSVIAVICNSALIFFTGERFSHHSMYTRTLYFIIFEHLVLGFKFAMAAFIPDIPAAVEIQLKRQDLLTGKVFEDQPDDDGEVTIQDNISIDLSIFLTDDERLG